MMANEQKRSLNMDPLTRKTVRESDTDAMTAINSRIRDVLDHAPSDATAELEIRKDKAGFQGLLKVFSRQRKFIGGNRAKTFSDVIDKVFEEVWSQISDWKSERNAKLITGER